MMPPQQFRKPGVVRHDENVLHWWQIPGEINQDICGCEIQLRSDGNLGSSPAVSLARLASELKTSSGTPSKDRIRAPKAAADASPAEVRGRVWSSGSGPHSACLM